MTTVLDQEVYTEPEAARLLSMSPSTLAYWLHGGTRRGTTYMPILRREPRDTRWVTWAEFVEAGWLRAYRRDAKVPMSELRAFIQLLRDDLGVPYPLAHERPFVSGRNLVVKAQQRAGLADYWRLVDQQGLLTLPTQLFVDRITWESDGTATVAAGWRPTADSRSTVIIRPDVRFGRPSVGGVSTSVLLELSEEGASHREVAEEFGLGLRDVRWALSYENARQAAA